MLVVALAGGNKTALNEAYTAYRTACARMKVAPVDMNTFVQLLEMLEKRGVVKIHPGDEADWE